MNFFPPTAWQGKRALPTIPECGRCGLWRGCKSPKMPPSGRGKRSILFVGEAPGEREDERGEQFVGKSGLRLREALRNAAGLELDDCWKANAARCRPPKNKIDDLHVECCRPYLLGDVRRLRPKVIVLLGGSAVRSLISAERAASLGSVARWVGWGIPSHELGAWLCPTYHPSYILRMRDPVLDRLFEEHLRAAVSLEGEPLRGEPLEALKKRVACIRRPRDAQARVRALARGRGGVLAFDYESNRLKPDDPGSRIVACSFCLDGEETFSVPVNAEMLPLISGILKDEKFRKVASNLKNEERWTRSIMGHGVAGWFWDTMLAAHVLDNRTGISGLKFQAFVNFGVADYERSVAPFLGATGPDGFNRVGEAPLDELLLYNGLDSLLEYRLCVLQRERMGLK